MISSALQQLYDEHLTIMKMLDRMSDILDSADRENHADQLRDILAFFREYADGYHHAKEEKLLFPYLSRINPAFDPLIEGLTDHHAIFRDMLRRAEHALATDDWPAVEKTLRGYVSDLLDHISAEDDELFVAAEEMLGDDEKETLRFLFIDRDEEQGMERKRELEAHASIV